MTETGMRRASIIERFQIGPVLTGLLIAAGIEMLIAALSWPFALVIVDAINYVIRVGRFEVVGPGSIYISWFLVATSAIPGIVVLLCGLRLGAWLCSGKTATSSNSVQV
jgi:hypothetical protein